MSEGSDASFAEIVASGPSQSAEEAAVNPVDEVIPTDQSIESLIDVNTGVVVVPPDFKEREVTTETQAARVKAEEAAKAEATEAEAAARKQDQDRAAAARATAAKKRSEKSFEETIVAANGTILAILSVALGVSAYRKHQVGQMSWRLAGLWGAGLAAFVGADYFVSMYVWKKCSARN